MDVRKLQEDEYRAAKRKLLSGDKDRPAPAEGAIDAVTLSDQDYKLAKQKILKGA